MILGAILPWWRLIWRANGRLAKSRARIAAATVEAFEAQIESRRVKAAGPKAKYGGSISVTREVSFACSTRPAASSAHRPLVNNAGAGAGHRMGDHRPCPWPSAPSFSSSARIAASRRSRIMTI